MPAELVQELLQQHSKLLDLMQTMASTAKVQAERSSCFEQQQQKQHQQAASAAVAAANSGAVTAAVGASAATGAPAGNSMGLQAQHQQSVEQLAEQHQLKRRFVKVQKVLLQHLQEARLQAAAAEAAREDACRWAQRMSAGNPVPTAIGLLLLSVLTMKTHTNRRLGACSYASLFE
jgi:hypothetical protein